MPSDITNFKTLTALIGSFSIFCPDVTLAPILALSRSSRIFAPLGVTHDRMIREKSGQSQHGYKLVISTNMITVETISAWQLMAVATCMRMSEQTQVTNIFEDYQFVS